jgi:multidrug transporter EmrE-like cation transporter
MRQSNAQPIRTERPPSAPSFRRLPNWGAPLRTLAGNAYLVGLSEVKKVDAWRRVWSDAGHDDRFYEILDGTIPPFEYHYLILEDTTGRVRAIQPVFVHDKDILEGIPDRLHGPAKLLNRLARFRILWVGPSVGEAALGAESQDRAWCAWALSLALPLAARRVRAPLVVLKDFPSELRPVLQVFIDQGYTRIPSMPAVALDLDFRSFDEHSRSVSGKTRGDLRRKFRDASRHPPISVEVRNDISDRLDELYPLYLQVHNHAAMRFETLTPDYFRRLGREMPDVARFFIWTQEGRSDRTGLPGGARRAPLLHRQARRDRLGLPKRGTPVRERPAQLRSEAQVGLQAPAAGPLPMAPESHNQRNSASRRPVAHPGAPRAPAAEIPQRARAMREESPSRHPEDRPARPMFPWYAHPNIHLALNAALVTFSELLLKKGAMAAMPGAAPPWLAWTGVAALGSLWVLAGILCYLASFAIWLYLLRTVPLHVAFPVTNLSHALIPVGAWVLFGERFGVSRGLGIVLILIGTWFIARPPHSREGSR